MSFGTLALPTWLLMAPGRIRPHRVLMFLCVVGCSYLALGMALSYGATTVVDKYEHLLAVEGFRYVELITGAILIVASEVMDSKKARAKAAGRAAQGGDRVMTWRSRVMNGDASKWSLIALLSLALAAVAIEAASMLPYLAGIGIISTQASGWPMRIALLTGYCLVMITPALVLTAGRVIAHNELETLLRRLDRWFVRNARTMMAWVTGVMGFIMAAHGAHCLWFAGS
ncbi:hypothetical protein D9T14_09300 [Propionibacterium australiense]|nr:hypothetical protein D7U36_10670 [Propionibacterium australiense]RLP08135.1 hypothetical protein D9T14_09300 [Propionibacterium australiense]